jgi:O-antigen/teichoic acid export membrane protein
MVKLNFSVFNNKHVKVLIGNAFTSIVGVLTGALINHNLSVDFAGIWWIFISFVTFCEAARYGLLATATVKFYAGTEENRARTVIGSIWVLALALTVVILAANASLFAVFSHSTDVQLQVCIKWVGITYLSSLPADVAFWKLQSDEKYGAYFWFRMLNSFTTITAFIVLWRLHHFTLENALLWNFLTNCLSSIVGLVFNMTGLKYITHKTTECIGEILTYGKYTLLTTTSSVLLSLSDIWIIDFMLGPAPVAVYSVAVRIMPILDLPLRSIVTTGMSEMAIQYNQKNLHQVTYIFKKYTGMLTIAFVPIIIIAILFGNLAIMLYGGKQYSGSLASTALSIFMVIAILYPLDRFNGLALDITNKAKINSYKVALMLGVKVIGAIWAIWLLKNVLDPATHTADYINQFPILGVAFSVFFSTLAGILFGHYHLRKNMDYTLPGILSLGYTETKYLMRKMLNLKSKP